MPTFRYVGDDERTFPHVSLTVAPGDTVDIDECPDPRFFTTTNPAVPAAVEED